MPQQAKGYLAFLQAFGFIAQVRQPFLQALFIEDGHEFHLDKGRFGTHDYNQTRRFGGLRFFSELEVLAGLQEVVDGFLGGGPHTIGRGGIPAQPAGEVTDEAVGCFEG